MLSIMGICSAVISSFNSVFKKKLLKTELADTLEEALTNSTKDELEDLNRCWNSYVSKVMELLKYLD